VVIFIFNVIEMAHEFPLLYCTVKVMGRSWVKAARRGHMTLKIL
jgi:hypothetical protein